MTLRERIQIWFLTTFRATSQRENETAQEAVDRAKRNRWWRVVSLKPINVITTTIDIPAGVHLTGTRVQGEEGRKRWMS